MSGSDIALVVAGDCVLVEAEDIGGNVLREAAVVEVDNKGVIVPNSTLSIIHVGVEVAACLLLVKTASGEVMLTAADEICSLKGGFEPKGVKRNTQRVSAASAAAGMLTFQSYERMEVILMLPEMRVRSCYLQARILNLTSNFIIVIGVIPASDP